MQKTTFLAASHSGQYIGVHPAKNQTVAKGKQSGDCHVRNRNDGIGSQRWRQIAEPGIAPARCHDTPRGRLREPAYLAELLGAITEAAERAIERTVCRVSTQPGQQRIGDQESPSAALLEPADLGD